MNNQSYVPERDVETILGTYDAVVDTLMSNAVQTTPFSTSTIQALSDGTTSHRHLAQIQAALNSSSAELRAVLLGHLHTRDQQFSLSEQPCETSRSPSNLIHSRQAEPHPATEEDDEQLPPVKYPKIE